MRNYAQGWTNPWIGNGLTDTCYLKMFQDEPNTNLQIKSVPHSWPNCIFHPTHLQLNLLPVAQSPSRLPIIPPEHLKTPPTQDIVCV